MARFDPTRSRYPFPSYPRGWFAVAFSHEVGEGDVLTRQAFGEELVLVELGLLVVACVFYASNAIDATYEGR